MTERQPLPDAPAAELLEPRGWMITGREKGRSDSWDRSRICVTVSGEQSTVLLELTKLLFPEVKDVTLLEPYWKDHDPENEVFSNIAIRVEASNPVITQPETFVPTPGKPRGRPAGNKYGAPAHSPEYQKEYYRQNKEKFALAQKKYYEKVRTKYAKEFTTVDDGHMRSTKGEGFETYTDEMQTRLEKIAEMAGKKLEDL